MASVGKLVREIKLEDQGEAFLIDDVGELIYFPGIKFEVDTRSGDRSESADAGAAVELQLADLDRYEELAAGGFAELSDRLVEGDCSVFPVTLGGEQKLVFATPIHADSLQYARRWPRRSLRFSSPSSRSAAYLSW